MIYAWEPLTQEHIALLYTNDPEAQPPLDGQVLAARRQDDSLAGWICLRAPGPHLIAAATSGFISLKLIDRIDRLAQSFGLHAYGIRTGNAALIKVLRKLPGIRELALQGRATWFMRDLANA